MPFSKLSLSAPILRALEQEGYSTPTPIQKLAIPHVMQGRDVLGCAQTGTGKTAAFALPILHRLHSATIDKTKRGPRRARALILSPTRELATQIGESFATYGKQTGLTHTCIFGGVSQFHQERALSRGVDIIVATPGRLIDLLEQGLVDLGGVEVLVLDEADRMLDMGFIQPIRRIAAQTPAPPARQTLMFSATMPREILKLAESLLRDPVKVSVDAGPMAVPAIDQSVFMVNRFRKQTLLEVLLKDPKITRALVFTRTKHGADKVGEKLVRAGVRAETIHGNKAQNQRTKALEKFRSGAARVLVATDVAARGLDVDNISHVINFDLPVDAEAYVHRIGRTARAGASGIALAFCDQGEERDLLRDIERLLGKKVRVEPTPVLPAESEPSGDWAESNRGEDRRPRSGGYSHPRPASQGHSHAPAHPHARPAHGPKPAHGHHPKPAHGHHHPKAEGPKQERHAPAAGGGGGGHAHPPAGGGGGGGNWRRGGPPVKKGGKRTVKWTGLHSKRPR